MPQEPDRVWKDSDHARERLGRVPLGQLPHARKRLLLLRGEAEFGDGLSAFAFHHHAALVLLREALRYGEPQTGGVLLFLIRQELQQVRHFLGRQRSQKPFWHGREG